MKRMTVYDHTRTLSYEQREHQSDKSTATVWCLHIRCIDAADAEALLHHFEEHFPVRWLTGEYLFQSWEVWGEESKGEHDLSLVVYFTADNPETAYLNAKYMAQTAYCWQPSRIAISTSGDWAEQFDVRGPAVREREISEARFR